MQHSVGKNTEVRDDDDGNNEREAKRNEKIEKYK